MCPMTSIFRWFKRSHCFQFIQFFFSCCENGSDNFQILYMGKLELQVPCGFWSFLWQSPWIIYPRITQVSLSTLITLRQGPLITIAGEVQVAPLHSFPVSPLEHMGPGQGMFSCSVGQVNLTFFKMATLMKTWGSTYSALIESRVRVTKEVKGNISALGIIEMFGSQQERFIA